MSGQYANPSPDPDAAPFRSGIVAVVGRANAGKSTLLNRMVGEKISIVSPIVQTTRNLIRGFVNDRRGQLILTDTPGLHRAQSELGRKMNRLARHATTNVDLILLVFDGASGPREEDEGWMRRLLFAQTPCLFILNKCDLPGFDPAPFHSCRETILAENQQAPFDDGWERTSAATGQGLDRLLASVFERVPAGQPLFDPEMVTDYPRKLAIADLVREKCLLFLRDELPHCLGVCVEEIIEKGDNWHIAVTLYVARNSQKPILIGPKGRMLRNIRRQAEPEIGAMFDVQASLELWVKVENHWDRNIWLLQRMGIAKT